jgi:transcriptional regulator GlxA family with amidase domain
MLCYDGANMVDVSGPLQVFASSNHAVSEDAVPYELHLASREGGLVRFSAGLSMLAESLDAIDALGEIDTLIIPGGSVARQPVIDPTLVVWVQRRARTIRRICSVCIGAFVLGATGLIDGRRVTTHWRWASSLGEKFPAIQVDADPIFINDGPFWTSAGVTAGMDLALALVESDLGHEVAIGVARELVMFLKRPGSQSQFSAALAEQTRSPEHFSDLHAWIASHLEQDLQVERLAEHLGMTPRTFARSYVAQVGRTPAKTVELMRLEAACRALEGTRLPLKRIAAKFGFGEEQNLRRVFLRQMKISPSQYRARFSMP